MMMTQTVKEKIPTNYNYKMLFEEIEIKNKHLKN